MLKINKISSLRALLSRNVKKISKIVKFFSEYSRHQLCGSFLLILGISSLIQHIAEDA